ncbi:hypothetical protein TKK_0015358 [Trichogramma kaykai]
MGKSLQDLRHSTQQAYRPKVTGISWRRLLRHRSNNCSFPRRGKHASLQRTIKNIRHHRQRNTETLAQEARRHVISTPGLSSSPCNSFNHFRELYMAEVKSLVWVHTADRRLGIHSSRLKSPNEVLIKLVNADGKLSRPASPRAKSKLAQHPPLRGRISEVTKAFAIMPTSTVTNSSPEAVTKNLVTRAVVIGYRSSKCSPGLMTETYSVITNE